MADPPHDAGPPADAPRVLIGEDRVRERVAELAARISEDYAGVDEVVLVGVLRGCFIFLADLARLLTIPRRIDFIALAAYSGPGTSPGAVRLIMDLRGDIAGRHVLVVEDIADTGATLDYLLKMLAPRGPASLRTCVFLRKRARLSKDVPIDYLGFDIPDLWVVGYGLDYADRHRALPYVGIVETEGGGGPGTPGRV